MDNARRRPSGGRTFPGFQQFARPITGTGGLLLAAWPTLRAAIWGTGTRLPGELDAGPAEPHAAGLIAWDRPGPQPGPGSVRCGCAAGFHQPRPLSPARP